VVESDVAPLNIGLATACHQAQNQQARRALMENDNVHFTSHMMMNVPHGCATVLAI